MIKSPFNVLLIVTQMGNIKPTIVPKIPDKLIHFIALNAYNAFQEELKY